MKRDLLITVAAGLVGLLTGLLVPYLFGLVAMVLRHCGGL